jgi:hypothetical protein
MIVETVIILRCANCQRDMVETKVPTCAGIKAGDPPHSHHRCEYCSPVGYGICLVMQAKAVA